MSQILFDAEAIEQEELVPVRVMGGWDPPMQEYFLTLFRSNSDLEDEDVLWSSSLYPSKKDRSSTARLRRVLADYGIEPPDNFWSAVEVRSDGNTIVAL